MTEVASVERFSRTELPWVWMHTSGRVELVDLQILTWQWPDTNE